MWEVLLRHAYMQEEKKLFEMPQPPYFMPLTRSALVIAPYAGCADHEDDGEEGDGDFGRRNDCGSSPCFSFHFHLSFLSRVSG